jgi:hypothetical protein
VIGNREYDDSLMLDIIPVLLRLGCKEVSLYEDVSKKCIEIMNVLADLKSIVVRILKEVCII